MHDHFWISDVAAIYFEKGRLQWNKLFLELLMSRLNGKTILLDNMMNQTGERITRQLLRDGANVIVPQCDPENAFAWPGDHLMQMDETSRLHQLKFDIGDAQGAEAVKAYIEGRFGGLNAFVTNNWPSSNKQDGTSISEWERVVAQRLKRQFVAAKTFMPLLAKQYNSVFILLSNSSVVSPNPCTGIQSAASIFHVMLARSLAFEMGDRPHVHNLILSNMELQSADNDSYITPMNVGEAVSMTIENAADIQLLTIEHDWRDYLQPRSSKQYLSCI